jgi:hypothetical protein
MLRNLSTQSCLEIRMQDNHNIKTDNSSCKMGENLKYFGTLPNQNTIQEEIKSGLKSGNVCCNSVLNLLSSSLLTKTIKIKIYRNYKFVCCFVGV